tara:strand:- start:278 stop:1606 length:1329 start_codon:yes stop_codon:yes gene_type:complete
MGLFDFLKKKELKEIKLLKGQLEKYAPVIEIDKEIELKNTQLAKENLELKELGNKYENSLETYKKLRKEVGLYESKLDLIEFGVYEPVYDFEHSDDYRAEQKRIIQLQKETIKDETAAICATSWNIEGSEAKGRAMTKKNIKLVLRAFNGESNTLIAKVKWNNVNQMQERIKKSFEAINKLGVNFTISIQEEYLDLKVKELTLEHEFQLKKQREKEELRAIQEQIREEEKAKREFEKAQKDAEKEEQNYQTALDKARKEIAELTGDKQDKLQAQIEILELELKESQEKKERAMSMAQQTRRGHVYVISNIGSFGENIYKIGMTRRLEPTDRVKELGDASVPFRFDIHAMMYSHDAPNLEKELHRAFDDKKVNMLNYRKEFFNVTLDEIENQIKESGIETEFTKLPEAIEYRETLAILQKMNSTETEKTIDQEIEDEFPSSLN